eukprot:TRINITY_DN26205_c0_g1_i1.p1 TRINITY_DN26205_c0_g1~~TRINITY_DN26205_c0_g1_i1.p1  ORF type:complete len:199 (+),score=16.63 TRINITY_DN26205_c0_g1_i1:111-707(+)
MATTTLLRLPTSFSLAACHIRSCSAIEHSEASSCRPVESRNLAACHRQRGSFGLPYTSRRSSRTVMVMESESDVSPSTTSTNVLSPDNPSLREKFAVLDTGKWECRSCGFVYDQSKGDDSYPISAGTTFAQLPEDWRCPVCGSEKPMFASKSREIAGFAENQKYGLGGNSLTGNQKSLLIYGSLLFFFALFLSGYFLQ